MRAVEWGTEGGVLCVCAVMHARVTTAVPCRWLLTTHSPALARLVAERVTLRRVPSVCPANHHHITTAPQSSVTLGTESGAADLPGAGVKFMRGGTSHKHRNSKAAVLPKRSQLTLK
jgi:hypothetical protein